MSVLEEREEYLRNPFFEKHEYGNFSPFYITIAICTVIGAALFILNIAIGCCSRYSQYWNDRHSGNRWIIPLWTSTPHKQPPLDLTELDADYIPPPIVYHPQTPSGSSEYLELQTKSRESAI